MKGLNLKGHKTAVVVIYDDASLEQVAPQVTVGLLLAAAQNLQTAIGEIVVAKEGEGENDAR
jgi:hypothetical protein